MTSASAPSGLPCVYPMAPLIRFTLISLYLALVVPLPALAPPVLAPWLLMALVVGLLLVIALTSEQVLLEQHRIAFGYPGWCSWLLRRGWSLDLDQITGLTPVATSQGGRVFYLRQRDGQAHLLPQRIARLDDFLVRFTAATGLNLAGLGRLTPPWTYQLLACLSALMLAGELLWLLLGGVQ